jgi:hypothetical protein
MAAARHRSQVSRRSAAVTGVHYGVASGVATPPSIPVEVLRVRSDAADYRLAARAARDQGSHAPSCREIAR